MSSINGYELIGELKNDNSGYSKWGFARKNGQKFFIKEFLSPIYPLDDSGLSEELLRKKRDICKQFEYEKRVFYNELNKCGTGNVVTITDFFRSGSKYYMVTEQVDAVAIMPSEVAKMPFEQKLLMLKTIAYSVSFLHMNGIVHGDIKADNILFKRTHMGFYTAKLIDFDSSFLESKPPESDEDFQGDMVYFAPESFLFIAEEGGELTTKIDIFALGILFHQYLTGELPGFDRENYDYVFEAVLDGCEVTVDSSIPGYIQRLISSMLNENPEKRPDSREVFSILRDGERPAEAEKKSENMVNDDMTSGRLIINMRKRSEEPEEVLEKNTGVEVKKESAETGGYFKKADDLM